MTQLEKEVRNTAFEFGCDLNTATNIVLYQYSKQLRAGKGVDTAFDHCFKDVWRNNGTQR